MKETRTYHLDYPELTMFQMVQRIAQRSPNAPSDEYFGNKPRYSPPICSAKKSSRPLLRRSIP